MIRNFLGRKLTTAVYSADLIVRAEENENGIVQLTEGFHKDIFETVAEKLNFTYEILRSSGFGRVENGSWSGIIGDLHSGKADFSLGIAVTYQRMSIIDFSFPMTFEHLTFITALPKRNLHEDAMLRPYTVGVWGLIFISLLATIFMLYFFAKLRQKYIDKKAKVINFDKCIEIIIATVLEISTNIPGYNITIRIFITFWLLYCIVITTAYKSKFYAILSTPNFEKIPESFEDLASSEYTWGLQFMDGAAYTVFQESENLLYHELALKMDIIEDPHLCLNKTLKSKFACIMYYGSILNNVNFFDPDGRLIVLMSPAESFFIGIAWGFPKNSSIKDPFNEILRKLHESGLIYYWQKEHFMKSRKVGKVLARQKTKSHPGYYESMLDNLSDHVPLSLKSVHCLLFIYIFGMCFATLIFVAEKFSRTTNTKTKRRTTIISQ